MSDTEEGLPTYNHEIRKLEKMIDAFDFFSIKTPYDKHKLTVNKEYNRAKMLYYDKTLLSNSD